MPQPFHHGIVAPVAHGRTAAAAPSVAEMSLLNSRLVMWLQPFGQRGAEHGTVGHALAGRAVMVPPTGDARSESLPA